MQEDRLAELASDSTRRERLDAAAAEVERERERECTFQPALSLSDQENQNPAAEVCHNQDLDIVPCRSVPACLPS